MNPSQARDEKTVNELNRELDKTRAALDSERVKNAQQASLRSRSGGINRRH